MFGEGDLLHVCQDFSRQFQDRVKFTQGESDPRKIFSKNSILLMTSAYEGMPMVLLEALSFGIPVVAFDCSPGLRECIIDGKTGFLIPPNDYESFNTKLLSILEDPGLYDTLSRQSLLHAQLFGFRETMDKWKKILELER